MSLVIRLEGVTFDNPNLPTLEGTPVGTLYEVDALEHWLFGSDYPANAGLVNEGALVASGDVPIQSENYLTISGIGAGLVSSLPETPDMCVCIAYRVPVAGENIILTGTLKPDTTRNGFAGFFNGSDLRVMERNGAGTLVLDENTTVPGSWAFMAISFSASGNYLAVQCSSTGHLSQSGIAARSVSNPVLNHAIGNAHYSQASYPGEADFAEFIVFDSPKTITEIDAIYTRSVNRLADREISLL